jgi:diguanylate cyclase (GGDEF)-like protein
MLTAALAVGTVVLLYAVLYLYRKRGDALQDMVTGLPSRDFFERYLQQCVARNMRHKELGFGVMLLDIRGFDELRRDLGRFAAEEILADFAERVTWCIRPSDVITRLNDDNFAIVLEDVRRVTDATRVAMRVQQSMTEAVTLAARAVTVRVNVGVTITQPGIVQEAPALIAEAETALDRAIQSGRPYVVFDPGLDARSLAELSLESELMTSLDAGQLRIAYSPLITSDKHELVGFTALMQWQHPHLGLLTAKNFIHLAENTREIVRMGEWALKEACAALIRLSEEGDHPLVVTVNVSETELLRGDVATLIETAFAEQPMLARLLRLEIPASVLSHLGPTIEATVNRLHRLGVGIHLDHLTATSIPLPRTMRLDVQGVRLSLGMYEPTDPEAPKSILKLLSACRAFAREIVVESVETAGGFTFVTALDPPVWTQGFFIAGLLSPDEIIALAQDPHAKFPRPTGLSRVSDPSLRSLTS